jgi:REP element-mobilizing transposase RayT
MSTGYQIYNQSGSYFLTLQVVDWIDIFSRKVYRDIILDSLDYCRKNKGLQIWAYVIMTNHIHCILSAENGNLSDIIRDFKRHTASNIIAEIQESTESRKDWML